MMIGRLRQCLDLGGDVRDRVGHGQVRDDVGVLPKSFDLDLESRIPRREDGEALLLVVCLPAFPAARGHPQPVDEDDGVGGVCIFGHDACSFLAGCNAA